MSIEFLTVDDVVAAHADQIARYGGDPGLRDPGLLDSAVAQARATFDGEYLHVDIFTMAAAYLFHIVQNHPFLDGNKRAGLVAALLFLEINSIEISAARGELYDLTIATAKGRLGKREIAEFLRDHGQTTPG